MQKEIYKNDSVKYFGHFIYNTLYVMIRTFYGNADNSLCQR